MEKGRRIDQARAEAFQAHSQKIGGDYKTDRSLVGRHEASRETYAGYLPRYQDKNLLDILTQKGKEEDALTLVDLGCGKGQFLLDLARLVPPMELVGITSYPYHEQSSSHRTHLKEYDVQIHIGDMQKVKEIIQPSTVDIVTSVFAFDYLADPWWGLKQAYDIVKPGGIGLIAGFPLVESLKFQKPAVTQVRDYLSARYGMEITTYPNNFTQISFEKQKPHLTVPLSYSYKQIFSIRENKQWIPFPRYTYTVDPRVLQTAA